MYFLQEGDVIAIKKGHRINALVPCEKVFVNPPKNRTHTQHVITVDDQFINFAGVYIVEHVCMDGGGTGHGPHDIYPDGHHVYCVNVHDPNNKIDFFQSGCFTNMITDIEPISKAERWWTVKFFTQD